MAILKGKGCTLQQTISSTLTDVANVISLSVSGEASDTFETTTLGGVVFKTFSQTGYSSPGTVDAELFFDPALAGHVTIVALISSPADCVWKIKYSDAGPSSLLFTSVGTSLDQTIVMNDGVKAKVKLTRSGAPTRA